MLDNFLIVMNDHLLWYSLSFVEQKVFSVYAPN